MVIFDALICALWWTLTNSITESVQLQKRADTHDAQTFSCCPATRSVLSHASPEAGISASLRVTHIRSFDLLRAAGICFIDSPSTCNSHWPPYQLALTCPCRGFKAFDMERSPKHDVAHHFIVNQVPGSTSVHQVFCQQLGPLTNGLPQWCDAGLQTHVVLDSGRTNVSPNTRSILVLGPADASLLDPLTSSLKLLS